MTGGALVEVNEETRELIITALRAYRTHQPASGPGVRMIDDTVEDLATGRVRVVRATAETWRTTLGRLNA